MKLTAAIRRKFRVRNKLKKISKGDRLRLSISRSTKNISAQIIDDKSHATILSASSNEKEMRSMKKNKTDISVLVAEKLAKKAVQSAFFTVEAGGHLSELEIRQRNAKAQIPLLVMEADPFVAFDSLKNSNNKVLSNISQQRK